MDGEMKITKITTEVKYIELKTPFKTALRETSHAEFVRVYVEDESGFVNLVVWRRVYEKYVLLIKTASFLGVRGRLQKQDGVVHLVADAFWDPRKQLGFQPNGVSSRDFR